MTNEVFTRGPDQAMVFEGCASVLPASVPAAIRFSRESFLGIVVVALLLLGLGSGIYKKVRHDEAADAYQKGERDIAKRDLSSALRDYTSAIQSDHRYYDAYCRRAEVYAQLGDAANAADDVKQAIAIHPLWPFALDLRRQFAYAKGKVVWTPIADSFELKPIIY